MNRAKVKKLFLALEKANPHPKIELQHRSHFELLIAIILSAQTTDIKVNEATKVLFKVANTPQKILDLGEAKLKDYIKTIGLYNAKAKNVIKTCEVLIKKYHGKIPRDRDSLEQLPGVGRKTANVYLNTAFHEPVIAVDTHVFRVANRTKLAIGKTPLEIEEKLLKIIPDEFKTHASHWLVLHGRYVCKAKKPDCTHCVIEKFCEYKEKIDI